MPEGDTVAGLARRLGSLVNGVVTHTDLRWPSIATASLNGLTLREVRAAGKYLLMDFGEAVLISHLRLEGRWEVSYDLPPSSRWLGQKVRAVLALELPAGDKALLLGSQLRKMHLVAPRGVDSVIGHLGPDPLNDRVEFDEELAQRLLLKTFDDVSDSSIGAALVDQRRIAGIGNVIRSEVLFLAQVNPAASLQALAANPAKTELMVRLARDILRMNVNRPHRTTTINQRERLWVYGRERRRCLLCGTPITKSDLLSLGEHGAAVQRVVYWCSSCQSESLTARP